MKKNKPICDYRQGIVITINYIVSQLPPPQQGG